MAKKLPARCKEPWLRSRAATQPAGNMGHTPRQPCTQGGGREKKIINNEKKEK